MVGREVGSSSGASGAQPGAVRLSVRGLRREGAFQDVSFDLRAGEVLGFAGLVGARRTDVGLALFGIAPADGGEIELDGDPGHRHQSARRHGARDRLQHRGPPAARARHAALDRREHLAAVAAPLPVTRRHGAPRGGAGDRRGIPAAAEHPRPVGRYAGVVALRRQPAEGRHQQVAGDEPESADPRRADPRHRRRRQGGGPSADRRPGGAGAWRSSSSARTCPRCWR